MGISLLPFVILVRQLYQQLAHQGQLGNVIIDLGVNYTQSRLKRYMYFAAIAPFVVFVCLAAFNLAFLENRIWAISFAAIAAFWICLKLLFVGSRGFGRTLICENGLFLGGDGVQWDDIGRYGWTAEDGKELFIQTWSGNFSEGRTIRLHVPAERCAEVDLAMRQNLRDIERVPATAN
jgi:hypothetical protein